MANRKGRPIQVYMPEEMRAELEALAEQNQRPIVVEIRNAIQLYLQNPQRISGGMPSKAPQVPQEPSGGEKQENGLGEAPKAPRKGRKGS